MRDSFNGLDVSRHSGVDISKEIKILVCQDFLFLRRLFFFQFFSSFLYP